jgi:uncharacterized protein YraI
MKMRNTARAAAVATLLAGLAWPAAQAFAQVSAYTSSPVYLYAGPSGDYPVVSSIGAGVPVEVMGCVSDYSWCDVSLPDLRGWVYAAYLSYPYEGEYVPLQGYGSVIGLPIVGFSIGAYWDHFYRNRPWYGDRDRWAHAPAPGYGIRPAGPPPGARLAEPSRPFVAPGNVGRPGQPGMVERPGQPGMVERPGQPGMVGRPGPQGFPGNAGAPRPEAGAHMPGRPGGNFGQPHPMQPEGAPRPPGPQGGFRPGPPAGGFEHGAPPMRAPGPMAAPARPAAPQGGHPSGGEGGDHRDNRPGQ